MVWPVRILALFWLAPLAVWNNLVKPSLSLLTTSTRLNANGLRDRRDRVPQASVFLAHYSDISTIFTL